MAHRVAMFERRSASALPSRRSANTNHAHVVIAVHPVTRQAAANSRFMREMTYAPVQI
jgi:hypothetical protein